MYDKNKKYGQYGILNFLNRISKNDYTEIITLQCRDVNNNII